jgi:hypothetical protein
MPPINAYIDLHCERIQDGWFEEPFNTLSNLTFFVVAYLLYRNHKNQHTPFLIKFFIAIIIIIGTGSIIFHSSARMWGALSDSIPIAIFAVTYVFAFARHILRAWWMAGFLVVGAYIATYFGVRYMYLGDIRGKMPDGYVSMIPSVYFMAGLTLLLYALKNSSALAFLKITLIAGLAVFFRTIDPMICEDFLIGSHFLWHMLAAAMIYMMVAELARKYRRVDIIS